jgi:translation initiation factor IF-2
MVEEMVEEVENNTTEEKKEVVEKRLKPTLIRRRAKKKPPEEPAPAEAAAAEPSAEGAEVVPPTPTEVVEEAPKVEEVPVAEVAEGKLKPGEKMPTGKPVGRIELEKKEEKPAPRIGVVGHIEQVVPEVKEDWRERARKGPKRRKSKAEMEMEAIQRAGGLKQYATTVREPEEEAGAAPRQPVQDRVFRPAPSRRKRPTRGDFKKPRITEPKAIKKVIRVEESVTVAELSRSMGVRGNELVRKLMDMGTMATLNQQIDVDAATLLAEDYGYTIEHTAFKEEEILVEPEAKVTAENLEPRAPVVTVMGHVDHGKTSILDFIRKTSVATGEAGGITQHIGAYEVTIPKGKITFIDTPGHAAFTSMRSRGAQVTDIVVLVVAADDGVMPQTIEAIDHAKAAGVPIVIAINKSDRAEARPEKVKQELTEHGLVTEEWGGDTICVPTSAKTGDGIGDLLEMILLQAEMLDLRADPTIRPKGVVIESRLDKGRGPVATVLVQEGTLKGGQQVICGLFSGKIRAMQNAEGAFLEEASPAMAVEVQGLGGVPAAGDELVGVSEDKDAKMVAELRQQKLRDESLRGPATISLEELSKRLEETKELRLVVKSDVHGSTEAVTEALNKLSTDAVKVEIIHKGVGGINESDVLLAAASEAVAIGFNVSPDGAAKREAESKGVEIKTYRVIYELLDDVRKAMEGLLAPEEKEVVLGHAEVRDIFRITKIGTIAGCYVTDGKIQRNAKARLLRDQTIVFEGKISSLRRFKDDVKEVTENYECGIGLENFSDIKNGDVIEAFIIEQIAATL